MLPINWQVTNLRQYGGIHSGQQWKLLSPGHKKALYNGDVHLSVCLSVHFFVRLSHLLCGSLGTYDKIFVKFMFVVGACSWHPRLHSRVSCGLWFVPGSCLSRWVNSTTSDDELFWSRIDPVDPISPSLLWKFGWRGSYELCEDNDISDPRSSSSLKIWLRTTGINTRRQWTNQL